MHAGSAAPVRSVYDYQGMAIRIKGGKERAVELIYTDRILICRQIFIPRSKMTMPERKQPIMDHTVLHRRGAVHSRSSDDSRRRSALAISPPPPVRSLNTASGGLKDARHSYDGVSMQHTQSQLLSVDIDTRPPRSHHQSQHQYNVLSVDMTSSRSRSSSVSSIASMPQTPEHVLFACPHAENSLSYPTPEANSYTSEISTFFHADSNHRTPSNVLCCVGTPRNWRR